MNWYYIDGPNRVGPINESEWAELLRTGKITPETLVWYEGMAKWTPYRQVAPEPEPPELEEEAEAVPEDPHAWAARLAELDFTVNVNTCVSRAWTVFKGDFWMLVGATLLTLVVVGVGSTVPILEIIIPMAFQGVLMGGLFYLVLRLMRGQPVQPSDLFAGFSSELFKPLALQTLVSYLVSQLCFLPALIAFKMKDVTMQNFATTFANDPQTGLVLLLVVMACMIPAFYFGFCWMFSIPLIVDKKLGFWPAMQLSRTKVLQHPWRIGVLASWAIILGSLGFLGFFIGIIFTIPLNYLVMLFLYEDIFNAPAAKPEEEKPQTE
jgi:uncharacterized membrane protein